MASEISERLAAGRVDLLDIGCSPKVVGALQKALKLETAVGVDASSERVALALLNGLDAVVGDPLTIGSKRGSVRLVTMSHYLHKSASRVVTAQLIQKALSVARDAVVLVTPFAEENGYLLSLEQRLYFADWSRSSMPVTAFDFWNSAREKLESGEAVLVLLGRARVLSSHDPSVISLWAPRNVALSETAAHQCKGGIVFSRPVYQELVGIFVMKSADGTLRSSWAEIASALGHCEFIKMIGKRHQAVGEGQHSAAEYRSDPPAAAIEMQREALTRRGLEPSVEASSGELARRVLIVCGVPRSGTTALVRLLNSHRRIALGIERFRFRLQQTVPYRTDLFSRDRFFTFLDEDGAGDVRDKFKADYDLLYKKWDHCAFVGDKVPRAYTAAEKIWAELPDATFVFVARDPIEVAASWQRRANDEDDSAWPAENDFRKSVIEWNKGIRIALLLARLRPDKFLVVRYFRGVDESCAVARTIFGRLGLEADVGLRDVAEALHEQVELQSSELSIEQMEIVSKEADWKSFRELLVLQL